MAKDTDNEETSQESDVRSVAKPLAMQPFFMNADAKDEHPLEYTYLYSLFKRPVGAQASSEDYAQNVTQLAVFCTVEQFWRIYSHLRRPNEIKDRMNFHVFKHGINPVWEDEANSKGGKWIIRLKKGLSSRVWENLLLAMLGEQFMVGEEICGAVCSIKKQEDIVSLWNRSADNAGVKNRIRDTLRRVLNLPSSTMLEYKPHHDCLRDHTSYRNTRISR